MSLTTTPLGQIPPCTTSSMALVPTCLWGTCMSGNSSSNSSYSCICLPGYRHDRLTGRYNNCGMPDWAPWAGGVTAIFICTIASIFNFYIFKYKSQPGTSLRRMAMAGVISAVAFDAAAISLHAEATLEMPWWGAIFNNIGTMAIAIGCGVAVTSALKPIAVFSHTRAQMKPLRFVMYFVIPSFVMWGCVISTIVGFASGSEQIITEAMGFVYIILGVTGGVCAPLYWHYMTLLLRSLDEAISGTERVARDQSSTTERRVSSPPVDPAVASLAAAPSSRFGFTGGLSTRLGFMVHAATSRFNPMDDSSSHHTTHNTNNNHSKKIITTRDKIVRLRRKVLFLRLTSVGCACLLVVTCGIASGLQFGARTFPFSWLFYYMVTCGIGLFSMQLTHYAKREASKPASGPSQGSGDGLNSKSGNAVKAERASLGFSPTPWTGGSSAPTTPIMSRPGPPPPQEDAPMENLQVIVEEDSRPISFPRAAYMAE